MKIRHKTTALTIRSKIWVFIKEKGEQGASIEEIDSFLVRADHFMGRRTLQRRLDEMQPEWVIAKGSARATRYYTSTPEDIAAFDAAAATASAGSKQSNIVAKPVEHNRQFLEQYEPGKTSYLTREDKEILAAIGKTDSTGQPGIMHAKQILPRFLPDLIYNSCRLEGNPYSFSEVQQLINGHQSTGDKTFSETQLILNYKQAVEFIVFGEEQPGLNKLLLTNLHAILSDYLLPDPALQGTLRFKPLTLALTGYIPPAHPPLIEMGFEMILEKATQIDDPFERSFFLLVHLTYLQPFDHVNNLLARLAMNIPFLQNNLSPLSFSGVVVDLYNKALATVYEVNRVELLKNIFITAYKRSAELYIAFQQSPDDPVFFRKKYQDTIRDLVARIVTGSFSTDEAAVAIKEISLDIEEKDRSTFIEQVNTELRSLHEGNIGRFKIRPEELKVWKESRPVL